MNILLVDDHPENLLALEAVLDSPEYRLIKVGSGEEALKWVLKEDFAVILLDVQMPGLDGFETAKLIKRRKKSKNVPIIFITAISQASEHVLRGYAAGGIDYIFKPFEPETLRKKVQGFVKLHQTMLQVKAQSQLLQDRTVELEQVNVELERATSALRKTEALARAISDVSIDTILTLDPEGQIINANPAIQEMFGYSIQDVLGQPATRILPEFARILDENRPELIETLAFPNPVEREPFPIEISIRETTVDEQQIIVCSIRDISERQEIEKARKEQYSLLEKLVEARTLEIRVTHEKLRHSEMRFRKTFELSPNLMAILSLEDGRYIDVNESWEKYTGYRYDEVKDSTLQIITSVDEGRGPLFRDEASLHPVHNLRVSYRTKSGELREGLWSTEILEIDSKRCLLSVLTDITERLLLEKEMARLDRLDLIGEMAAGIAHEIRNPMTTVRGFLQMMSRRSQHVNNPEYFDLMIGELDRANSIITEFLTLSKNQTLELKNQNLNELLRTLFPLIQADAFSRKNDVSLEIEDIPNFKFDQREIRQMILNLARNGLEAMPGGGTLRLHTYRDGEEVIFEVRDQGNGISPEILDKLGTPFFTTKENGTGLGLAVCFGIAEKHKARIAIQAGDNGTTFFVRFPVGEGEQCLKSSLPA